MTDGIPTPSERIRARFLKRMDATSCRFLVESGYEPADLDHIPPSERILMAQTLVAAELGIELETDD